MKTFTTMALAAFLAAGTLLAGEGPEIRVIRPWVQVRSAPAAQARAVALAYGNDRFDVLARQGDWFKIKAHHNQTGWVEARGVRENGLEHTPARLAAKAFDYARDLGNTGRTAEGLRRLFEVVRTYPGSVESYQATRRLLVYFPRAGRGGLANERVVLPAPQQGRVPTENLAAAARLVPSLFIQYGESLLARDQNQEAAMAFEAARSLGGDEFVTMEGLYNALAANLETALRQNDPEEITPALMAYKDYFPARPLPESLKNALKPEAMVQFGPQTPAGQPSEPAGAALPALVEDNEDQPPETTP
ncbi:MAG: SH3 domain-containing protein [Deltaproteobacteria bacterium]|nr:SH3 domain-containing protein [Deltaproteobacteria bacterium]